MRRWSKGTTGLDYLLAVSLIALACVIVFMLAR